MDINAMLKKKGIHHLLELLYPMLTQVWGARYSTLFPRE